MRYGHAILEYRKASAKAAFFRGAKREARVARAVAASTTETPESEK
jgi:hypothetical protein